MEKSRTDLLPAWLGDDLADHLGSAGGLFVENAYPLPDASSGCSHQQEE